MIEAQLAGLFPAVYRLYWNDGSSSVAAVGQDAAGRYWFAPANWINVPSFDWGGVKALSLIQVQEDRKMPSATQAVEIVNSHGQTEPCRECGEDYPRADLFCPKCR